MKKLILLLFIGFSCTTKKTIPETIQQEITAPSCLEGYLCTTEIKENTSLMITKNDSDKLSYQLIPNTKTSVLVYKTNRVVEKDLKDGSYREEIIFELENNNKDFKLEDVDLQKVKMLFGRFCYCKGKTGYYKITSGKLEIKNKVVTLNFKVNEVPQIVNSIKFELILTAIRSKSQ
jgi:hypothetical protein